MQRSTAGIGWVGSLCVAGLALTQLPERAAAQVRAVVCDILAPGQSLARSVQTRSAVVLSWLPSGDSRGGHAGAELRDRLDRAEHRVRVLQLQVDLAQCRERDAASAATQIRGAPGKPLLIPALLEAQVLGEDAASSWRRRLLVAAGSDQHVVETSLVLEDFGPLVDQGAPQQVSAGDAVYAGRAVVGKIAEVGRYTSRIQRVTEAGYTGRARLARRTPRGLEFGAEGILAGDGSSLCRLKRITTPVNVGDEVFTGGTDGVLPYPMHYGSVARAELEPGATEWTVFVQPQAQGDLPESVSILRIAVNRLRVLSN